MQSYNFLWHVIVLGLTNSRVYKRTNGRGHDELRPISIETNFVSNSGGSALITCGSTMLLCTANVDSGVPQFRRDTGLGWLTAEYGMLPGSTHTRTPREAASGRQGGRTMEIQRLIGRSLRQAVDFKKLGESTVQIDCDVLQADGGTRTAAITGSCVALYHALQQISPDAFLGWVAAVSVGEVWNEVLLDMDYSEDGQADSDLNVVMMQERGIVEIQGTAERKPLAHSKLQAALELAEQGVSELFKLQESSIIT